MGQRGHDVTVLHGEMTIEDRARTIQQFKDSVYKVLITTNVCARGICFVSDSLFMILVGTTHFAFVNSMLKLHFELTVVP